eukprot:scaffold248805_cov22-Tisochrysis_lutea.AAC.1
MLSSRASGSSILWAAASRLSWRFGWLSSRCRQAERLDVRICEAQLLDPDGASVKAKSRMQSGSHQPIQELLHGRSSALQTLTTVTALPSGSTQANLVLLVLPWFCLRCAGGA